MFLLNVLFLLLTNSLSFATSDVFLQKLTSQFKKNATIGAQICNSQLKKEIKNKNTNHQVLKSLVDLCIQQHSVQSNAEFLQTTQEFIFSKVKSSDLGSLQAVASAYGLLKENKPIFDRFLNKLYAIAGQKLAKKSFNDRDHAILKFICPLLVDELITVKQVSNAWNFSYLTERYAKAHNFFSLAFRMKLDRIEIQIQARKYSNARLEIAKLKNQTRGSREFVKALAQLERSLPKK